MLCIQPFTLGKPKICAQNKKKVGMDETTKRKKNIKNRKRKIKKKKTKIKRSAIICPSLQHILMLTQHSREMLLTKLNQTNQTVLLDPSDQSMDLNSNNLRGQ